MLRVIELDRPSIESLRTCYLSIQIATKENTVDANNNAVGENDSQKTDFNYSHNDAGKSPHQLQLGISRRLVSILPDVLVSPTTNVSQIIIVAPKSLICSLNWTEQLRRNNLELVSDMETTCAHIEACVPFSLRAKMAPEWNAVGGSLIQGTDFLKTMNRRTYRQIAIKTQCASSNNLYLELRASVVRLYALEIWQLEIQRPPSAPTSVVPPQLGANLRWDRADVQPAKWCYLLPKLSRGQVVGVRRTLSSASSGFDTYAQMRCYWSETYGYTLPQQPPMHYYEVNFRRIGPMVFTYPSYCVLCAEPAIVTTAGLHREQELALYAFAQMLSRKLPSVLGSPLRLRLAERRAAPGRLTMPTTTTVDGSQPPTFGFNSPAPSRHTNSVFEMPVKRRKRTENDEKENVAPPRNKVPRVI